MTIQKTLRMFNWIKGVITSTGEAPTIAEIGRQFNMSSSASVFKQLRKMQDKGWIRIIPNVPRGIRIVELEKNKAA